MYYVFNPNLHPWEGIETHPDGGNEDEADGEEGDELSAVGGLRLLEQVPQRPLVRHEIAGAEILDHLHFAVIHVLLLHLAQDVLPPGVELV